MKNLIEKNVGKIAIVGLMALVVFLGALTNKQPAAPWAPDTASITNVPVQAEPVRVPTDVPAGDAVAKATTNGTSNNMVAIKITRLHFAE